MMQATEKAKAKGKVARQTLQGFDRAVRDIMDSRGYARGRLQNSGAVSGKVLQGYARTFPSTTCSLPECASIL